MELELYTKGDMNDYALWYIQNNKQYPDDKQALKEGLYLNDFNKTRTSNIEDMINLEQLALDIYPVDNQETSKGCIDDMNLSDRQTWISGAKKILDFFKKPLSSLEIQSIGRQNRNSQSTTPVITVTVEEPKQRIVILNPMSDNIFVQDVNVMGCNLVRWSYKGCEVDFGIGDDWATIYSVESKDKGKGYATKLLGVAKAFYEQSGKKFGGTVALNDTMSHIYKKLNIEEYDN
jgi:hypothetical protein